MLGLITSPFIPKFEFCWFHVDFTKIFLSLLPLPIIMQFLDYTSMCETGVSNPRMSQRHSFGFSCLQLYLCDFSHSLSKEPNSTFSLMPMCVGNQGSDRLALADPMVMS